MGHAIGGGFLKATTKEAAMKEGYAAAEEFAYYNVDRGENYYGSYHGNFRFYDKVFNTEEEAQEFFDELGSYCDGVVMVKEVSSSIQEKHYKKLEDINKKQREFEAKILEKFKERTSKSIGCRKCGTRINSEVALQRRLYCPNCGNWLVTDSVKERYKKFEEQIEFENKQFANAHAEKGKPKYWAKYEVHC